MALEVDSRELHGECDTLEQSARPQGVDPKSGSDGCPPFFPRQTITQHPSGNDFAGWFGSDLNKLNIVATYNPVYNAAILVESGGNYAVTLDRLTNTSLESILCFRPLCPRLESGLNIIWKKYQVFSPAAELFLNRLKERFPQTTES